MSPICGRALAVGLVIANFMLMLGSGIEPSHSVSAATSPPVRLVINGESVESDVPPAIVDGRTLVPIRVVAEKLGSRVTWIAEERRVRIEGGEQTIELTVDLPSAEVNGAQVALDVAPRIMGGRTMVPIRFVAEAMGRKVDYDQVTRTVSIGPYTISNVELVQPQGVPEIRVKVDGPAKYRVRQSGSVVTVHVLNASIASGVPLKQRFASPYLRELQVEASKEIPGAVQMTLWQNTQLQASVVYSDKTIIVGFLADVTQVYWHSVVADAANVDIKTTFPVRWVAEARPENNELILDLPNTYLKVRPDGPIGVGPLRSVRSVEGPVAGWTRLVFSVDGAVEVAQEGGFFSSNTRLVVRKVKTAAGKTGGKKVFLDAGHGGQEPGATGVGGLREKDVNLAITLKLRAILERQGYRVILSRDRDATVGLYDRPKLANDARADVFVSIHSNAFSDPRDHGTEIWYYNGNPGTPKLAEAIHQAMQQGVGLRDRGVKNWEHFVVVRYTTMPAVLVEIAFLTNPDEAKLLADPQFQERVAKAIAKGIENYFVANQ